MQNDKGELSPGDILRDYEIRSVIGRGGFGVVYKAQHRELGIEVAIKEFYPSGLCVRRNQIVQPSTPEFQDSFEESLERFIKEAKQLEKFRDCPNIVSCRDLFRANGTAYIVMDYVHGLPLSILLERREAKGEPFMEHDLLQVITPLLTGLQTVHGSAVYHRDIKPSNILIRRSDDIPILIDFGAAKHEISRHTKSFAPYSDGYAAMEQIGEGEIGPWTDIYGLGAVMWRMVAGNTPPYLPPTPITSQQRALRLMQGREDPLPTAKDIGDGRFSDRLLDTIDACLTINPLERVQNCDQLLEKLSLYTVGIDPSATSKGKLLHFEHPKQNQVNTEIVEQRKSAESQNKQIDQYEKTKQDLGVSQTLRTISTKSYETTPNGLRYTGFLPRLCASLIDLFILLAIQIPLLTLIYSESYWTDDSSPFILGPMDFSLNYLFPVVATVWFWVAKQATPGKMAFKAKIIDAKTGMPPAIGQYIGRYFAYIVSIIPLGLGFIWIAVNDKKQGWHDKLAGTIVVSPKETEQKSAIFDRK